MNTVTNFEVQKLIFVKIYVFNAVQEIVCSTESLPNCIVNEFFQQFLSNTQLYSVTEWKSFFRYLLISIV